ncbi:MAG TPA: STAS domain-containing protein [Gaiellales bacterium]|nr:STAS domain-containing protein [Gaiellales bacterium]
MNEEPPFAIERVERDGHVVVRVTGGVDMSTVTAFEQALDEAFAGTADEVRLDLSGVTYFGSEGVRALIAAEGSPGAAGRSVQIVASSPVARRVLEITGLV